MIIKEQMKKEVNKRKKEKCNNLNDNEKEQLKKYEKKGKKVKRDSLGDDEKEQVRKNDKNRKMDKRLQTLDERNSIFNNVQVCNMTDPSILTTPAFRLIEQDFKGAIQEGPTYICDICWKFEFRRNVIKLKEPKYQADIYNECTTGKSDWICKSCHNSMSKNKMPMQAQVNNLGLCPTFNELDRFCLVELIIISQIIPFMFIAAKTKGAQHGLTGQCVLVPTDLERIQTILPRSCNEEYLVSLALKRQLADKSVVSKQQIRPTLVNTALQKLAQINPFYSNTTIHNEWEDLSEQSHPVLWKLLTDKNARESKNRDQTDSDDDIEGNGKFKERELKECSSHFPTVMYNLDGPDISPNEIVNIAPEEGQIPVFFTSEPN